MFFFAGKSLPSPPKPDRFDTMKKYRRVAFFGDSYRPDLVNVVWSVVSRQKQIDMYSFVARQPIFDHNLEIYGYELLFRNGLENFFPQGFDADQATSNIIMDNFFLNNINSITDGKKAFINFTTNLLIHDFGLHLDKENLVIEILEDVFVNPETLSACKKLKDAGYHLALDDFVLKKDRLPLVKLANIIKIDLLATPPADRISIIKAFSRSNIAFLAEKVENSEAYEEAKSQGFTFFQGYFFCKPQIIQGRRLPENKANKLELIKAANNEHPDFKEITEVIKRDVSLTFKLLRFINSAAFGFSKEIDSIQQAVVYIGLNPLKKWVTLVALAELGEEKPSELIRNAILRARFCESLGESIDNRHADLYFLAGMFSRVDALMDKPLAEVLQEIPLAQEIKNALLFPDANQAPDPNNTLRSAFNLVKAYEAADWATVDAECSRLEINAEAIPEVYAEALSWTQQFLMLQKG